MLKDWTLFEKSWLILSVAVITALGFMWDDTLIGFVSSISGILAVVLVAKGKISSYFFGVIQAATYGYIAYTYSLYGESMLNLLFYLPLQFVGFYLWKKNSKSSDSAINGEEIYAKRLSAPEWGALAVLIPLFYCAYYFFLDSIGANLALFDALAVVLSIFAQILMIGRYAEQWLLWIVINMITIGIWLTSLLQSGGSDWTILAMWVAFLINSVYGYINWLKISKDGARNV